MKIDYKKMEELAKDGVDYGKIADILDIDLRTVINHIEGQKITGDDTQSDVKKYGTSRREDVAKLRLEQRMSVKEIAVELKISESLVREDLMAMGISISDQKPETK